MKLGDFDLASQAESGFTFNLAHPVSGEKLDAQITVRGHDSPTYRNATYAIVERIKAIKEPEKRPQEDRDKDGAELLAAVTVGWENIEDDQGQPITFSKEKAVEIYLQFDWIAEQVKREVYNRHNFFLTLQKD